MTKKVAAMTAALALAAPAVAQAGFKEPVNVLWQASGTPGDYFAWATAPIADLDRDHVRDVIISEPGFDQGITWVYSGATGERLYRFDGESGDENGYAIADAGDVNRDGRH